MAKKGTKKAVVAEEAGEALRVWRESLQLTQLDVALWIHNNVRLPMMAGGSLSHYERGRMPPVSYLWALAIFFGKPIGQLIDPYIPRRSKIRPNHDGTPIVEVPLEPLPSGEGLQMPEDHRHEILARISRLPSDLIDQIHNDLLAWLSEREVQFRRRTAHPQRGGFPPSGRGIP